MELVVLVPVLARPHRVEKLLESVRSATSCDHRVLFLTDPDDQAERDAIHAASGEELACGGTYAAKINTGVRATDEPLVFLGADDIVPQPGWFEAALRYVENGARVVGVNDLIARPHRLHATHFLMTRGYAERTTIDNQDGPCSTAYRHSFVDDELIATAQRRGAYVYAPESHVKHEHWMNGTAPLDETYEKGRVTFLLDRQTFRSRASFWT